MKKLILAGFAAAVAATTFAQGAGRAVYKPGQTTNPPAGRVEQSNYDRTVSVDRNDYDRTPGGSHIAMTPFALGIGGWGLPYGRNWAICGARLNLGFPNWTATYEAVYGLDVGLSGETFGEAGGILVNAFNNTTRDVYGLSVAGLWNQAKGTGSVALQLAAIYNDAEKLDGAQIGLVNHVHELHGVQLGLVNQAVNGGGLQIGLWNDSGNGMGSPIIGIVY